MDETASLRAAEFVQLNGAAGPREVLESLHGQVWDTKQLSADFEVLGFAAPFVIVQRRSDKKKGSLKFQHEPRFYFEFEVYDR